MEDVFPSENGDIPACYISLPEGKGLLFLKRLQKGWLFMNHATLEVAKVAKGNKNSQPQIPTQGNKEIGDLRISREETYFKQHSGSSGKKFKLATCRSLLIACSSRRT